MNEKTSNTKEFAKTILGAIGIIASCSMLFSGLADGVMAAEIRKTEQIFTSYNVAPLTVTKNNLPKGYKKADYTVISDPLEYFKDKTPTTKDLTKEEAAELGAQTLWEIFGVDLNDATIYMGYDSGTETFPRASWIGDVRFGDRTAPDGTAGTYCYFFTLDAVTGNRFTVSWGRTLSENVPLGLDMVLAQHPEAYTDLAKELAIKYDLVHGNVKDATYSGQGYSNNDPIISINVIGTNGEKALMTFSRYDKKLMGIGYDEEIKIIEARLEKRLGETEKQINQQQPKNNSDLSKLVPLP